MAHMAHNAVEMAPSKTTGTGRKSAHGFASAKRVAIEIELEVVGGTPAFTFTVQGLKPGGAEATASDWENVAVVVSNSTTAATAAPTVSLSVGRYIFYVDGLDKRFWESLAVNVTANTNVTYQINAYVVPEL